jgi:predicted phosphodiesterase
MTAQRFAVIADVHSNSFALEAVLADIARRDIGQIINLGDNANGPVNPARTIELLRAMPMMQVRGNGDRMTGEGGAAVRGSAAFARERLDADALRWLRELPLMARGEGWVACHGSLESDEAYLVESFAGGRTVVADPSEVERRLGDPGASLVLCGHTHIPRHVRLSNGVLVVNPGSVGLQAYTDQAPVPHAVVNGSPDARYAIIERGRGEWAVEFVTLAYDWAAAAEAARAVGWEEWARILETGYAV